MKWVRILLLGLLTIVGVTASAQQRIININERDRLRLRDLNLTSEQKRRLVRLVQRERLQHYMNQQELNEILTPRQREQLIKWREKRFKSNDSTDVKP
jgi:Spy/CpxP family protein refolding chaperone